MKDNFYGKAFQAPGYTYESVRTNTFLDNGEMFQYRYLTERRLQVIMVGLVKKGIAWDHSWRIYD